MTTKIHIIDLPSYYELIKQHKIKKLCVFHKNKILLKINQWQKEKQMLDVITRESIKNA